MPDTHAARRQSECADTEEGVELWLTYKYDSRGTPRAVPCAHCSTTEIFSRLCQGMLMIRALDIMWPRALHIVWLFGCWRLDVGLSDRASCLPRNNSCPSLKPCRDVAFYNSTTTISFLPSRSTTDIRHLNEEALGVVRAELAASRHSHGKAKSSRRLPDTYWY